MDTIETQTGRQMCTSDDDQHVQGSRDECAYCAEYLCGKADGRAEAKQRAEEALRLLEQTEECEDAKSLFDLCIDVREVLKR